MVHLFILATLLVPLQIDTTFCFGPLVLALLTTALVPDSGRYLLAGIFKPSQL